MIQLAEDQSKIDDVVFGCRVHDMVLDLIRSISSEENFITRLLLDGNKSGASSQSSRPGHGKVRRLALQSDGTVEPHMEDMKQVRTFISRGCDIGGKGGVLLSSFRHVRVLAIDSFFDITHQHLKPVQNLLHLRCLQLCARRIDHLGKEIATLKFLQTLDVCAIERGHQVVASVGLLTQLRCLRIRKPVGRVPDGIGKLTSLEELEIYYDSDGGTGDKEAWGGFIIELGGLKELRVLRLRMPDSLEYIHAQVHMVQSLRNLHKLEHLSLSVVVWPPMDADTETWEEAEGGSSWLLPRSLRQLFLSRIVFSRFPSFFLNASRLPILSHLFLHLRHLDAQGDLRILGELPELHFLVMLVDSTVQLVCSDATDDDACLFRKLRRCYLHWFGGVRLLLSSEEGSGGVSIRTGCLHASMLLGSGRNDKDVAPTLLPSVQDIEIDMRMWDFKDSSNGGLALEYFASLQSVTVRVICRGASAAEVEQVEAALRRAAGVHPNRPTLEVKRFYEQEMISSVQEEEVQQEGKSEGA